MEEIVSMVNDFYKKKEKKKKNAPVLLPTTHYD
ncbi:hypothetical protein QG37_01096 [Candidozyma auris]|uniref:Uncharacterized protein n=1 Tax=Candidozyma auris TaxID=498019 RepID=A0A0L0P5V2_CANAR|nr:hypothetical protein QG37_01096 [[Candida] auris]